MPGREAAFRVTDMSAMPGGPVPLRILLPAPAPPPHGPWNTFFPPTPQQLQGGKGGVEGGADGVQISCLFVLEVGCLLIIRWVHI